MMRKCEAPALSGRIRMDRWAGRRNSSGDQPSRRVAVVALDQPPEVAAQAVSAMGMQVVVAVAGSQTNELKVLRRRVAQRGVDEIVAYSSDWARQAYPSIYEAALTLSLGGRTWLLLDGQTGRLLSRGPRHGLGMTFRLMSGAVRALGEVFVSRMETHTGHKDAVGRACGSSLSHGSSRPRWVLIIWRGSSAAEGGSITHLKGVLSGFGAHGFRRALVTAYSPPAGIEVFVEELVVTRPSPTSHRFTRDTARLAIDRQMIDACRNVAVRLPIDLVYQRHAYLSNAGLKIATELEVPFVLEWNSSELWTNRNWRQPDPFRYLSEKFERVAGAREKEIVGAASVVAAVSSVAAQTARDSGGTESHVITLPNAVDVADIPAPYPIPVRAPGARLGWVGTFGPWHGAAIAVKALALLPSEIRLVMIGDGLQRPGCKQLAVQLGVNDRIDFVGTLGRADVIAQLQDCDVLLSPHVPVGDEPFFGSPTKVFEYMAIGRPVVASRLEQISEILEDGRTARLVAPGDPTDLAKGIWEVLTHDDRGSAMGMAARLEATQLHTWDQRIATLLSVLYQEAAS